MLLIFIFLALALYQLSVTDLMYPFDHLPEMEKYARMDMGSNFGHLMERIKSMRFTTARESYVEKSTDHDRHFGIGSIPVSGNLHPGTIGLPL